MAGQVRVIISDKEWLASLAQAPWELTQGLGGIPEIPPGTGMLFDLGFEQTVTVTTEPMLFPLDIAFLSESLAITEIYRDVQPGYHVSSTLPARYFLEVNAGELTGVDIGSQVSVDNLPLQEMPVASDWTSPMASFMGFTLMSVFMIGMVKNLTGTMFAGRNKALLLSEPRKGERVVRLSAKKCAFCGISHGPGETCEIVSPRDFKLLSWVGAPVPDYSFAVEPETKERKIDEVLKRLKEGVDGIQQSDNFRNFLLTMGKFHDYSIGNLILIMLQRPDATRVAGFGTWRDLGRWVKKGERGIAILAPCMPPKGTKSTAPEDSETEEGESKEEQGEIRPLFFRVVHVFDLSQTEGKPLPEFDTPVLTGEANEELFMNVMRLVKEEGVEASFEPRPNQDPDIKGMYYGKTIWVKPDESRAQQLKTLIHEAAHYYTEGVFRIARTDAETIAESVAFTIGSHFGFDTGTRSFPYVALWAKEKKVLEANLAAIRKVSAKIIDRLEQTANKIAGVAFLIGPQGLPVARLLEKWQKAKARNSTLAMRDLEALGQEYDIEDCKEALSDYRDIEPGDYDDREEYQDARDEAWDTFIECLESLADEEEEMSNSSS
ncbi:MAG: DUF192 domain-containing protein [Dehalococcoidales bacterium]|nr:DUF192 domain-containing protein [Dehalococcoidales bacterium]